MKGHSTLKKRKPKFPKRLSGVPPVRSAARQFRAMLA
jgi:hypothetical protein